MFGESLLAVGVWCLTSANLCIKREAFMHFGLRFKLRFFVKVTVRLDMMARCTLRYVQSFEDKMMCLESFATDKQSLRR